MSLILVPQPFLSLILCLHWLPIYFAPTNTVAYYRHYHRSLRSEAPQVAIPLLLQSTIRMPSWLLICKCHHPEWLNAIPESHHPQ